MNHCRHLAARVEFEGQAAHAMVGLPLKRPAAHGIHVLAPRHVDGWKIEDRSTRNTNNMACVVPTPHLVVRACLLYFLACTQRTACSSWM